MGDRRCAGARTRASPREADHSAKFYDIANRHPRQNDSELYLDGYALGLGLRIEETDVDVATN
jgi:hypothetical protein